MSLTAKWLPQLARFLESAPNVTRAVERWSEETILADDAFAGWYYRTGFQASLAGQLMVRAVECEEEANDGKPGTVTLGSRSVSRSLGDGAFLSLDFEEALAFFRGKRVVTPAEFDALRDRYRAGAFTARKLASEAMRERAQRAIQHGLDEGLPLEEIISSIDDAQFELGIEPATHAQLETIVRNNVATSYAAGRFGAMTDPEVMDLRPYWQYWTASDSRVREEHRALHGKVFLAGSDVALYYVPPLGHNCRCSTSTLSGRQFEKRELFLTEDLIEATHSKTGDVYIVSPAEGWEDPPAPLPALS